MIRDTRLWCKKSPEGGELEPGFAIQRLENSFCQPSSKWIPFLNQGRIREQKKTDGLCLSYAVPKIQRASHPIAPTDIRLWEIFALSF